MKKAIIFLAAIAFINYTNAQELKETYYNYASTIVKESGYIDKNGNPTGEWNYYLENGSLNYIINWTTKFTKEYYITGELKETRTFNPDTGANTGEWIAYYNNGNIKAKGLYNKNGEKNGEFITYLENGTLIRKELFKKGVKQE